MPYRTVIILYTALLLARTAFAQDGAIEAEAPRPFDAVPADAASPFGGVSIAPTRVELGEGTSSGRVTLYNSGDQPVTYRIEAVDLRPLEAGGYAELEDDAETPSWSATPLLRYAPRQVTLDGDERQVIKIVSRARRDTGKGEYRTHLRFSSIPLVEEDEDLGDAPADDRSVSVSVGLQYRITIPVLLRVGAPVAGTVIEAATLSSNDAGTPIGEVVLVREGERSSYLNIRLLDAEGEEAGLVKGVSVLPPLTRRRVEIPLNTGAGMPIRAVLESAEDGDEGTIVSEVTIR